MFGGLEVRFNLSGDCELWVGSRPAITISSLLLLSCASKDAQLDLIARTFEEWELSQQPLEKEPYYPKHARSP